MVVTNPVRSRFYTNPVPRPDLSTPLVGETRVDRSVPFAMITVIIIPIGLIVRLITMCINACYEKAAERRARREEERLAAEPQERAQTATVVTVVQGATEAPSRPSVVPSCPPPPYSASDPAHEANETSPLIHK